MGEAYRHCLAQFLEEMGRREPPQWSVNRLPLLACEAAGGNRHQALHVGAAWRALHLAGDLLDDVEDDLLAGRGQAAHAVDANMAIGLFVVSQQLLHESMLPLKDVIISRFHATVLHMTSGQHLDLSHRDDLTLRQYHDIVVAKSGSFFALALTSGALAAGVREVEPFEDIGIALGLLIQTADDDSGGRRPLLESDIALGMFSLPVLYALDVLPPPMATRLRELMKRAPKEPTAAAAAREIIVESGSDHYILAQLLLHHRRLRSALLALDPVQSAGLWAWSEKLCSKLGLPTLRDPV